MVVVISSQRLLSDAFQHTSTASRPAPGGATVPHRQPDRPRVALDDANPASPHSRLHGQRDPAARLDPAVACCRLWQPDAVAGDI